MSVRSERFNIGVSYAVGGQFIDLDTLVQPKVGAEEGK